MVPPARTVPKKTDTPARGRAERETGEGKRYNLSPKVRLHLVWRNAGPRLIVEMRGPPGQPTWKRKKAMVDAETPKGAPPAGKGLQSQGAVGRKLSG